MQYKKEDLIKSPLNYTGGKFKLLPKILPLFPDKIHTFVDLFGGGFNVGINVKADKIICNDIEPHVIDFLSNIQKYTGEEVHNKILKNVEKYQLSKTNKEGFIKARDDYNENQTWDMFYTVIAHCFNNQIRYNKKGEFNLPFGKDRSSYNPSLQNKLKIFVDSIDKTMEFKNQDFKKFIFFKKYFVYADPPYLISTATYNENGGWTEIEEKCLLNILDELNDTGIKFALSNVLEHKGRSNDILKEWSKKYKVHYLNYNYKNCSYHGKNTEEPTIEVLITNY